MWLIRKSELQRRVVPKRSRPLIFSEMGWPPIWGHAVLLVAYLN